MRPARLVPAALIALAALASADAAAATAARTAVTTWQIDAAESVFAVLTHRAGLAARLAHDHLIVARGATTTLQFDPHAPETTRFELTVPVLSLDVDPPAERKLWGPRLVELGALSEPLPEVDADDRADVRKAMLSPGQMNAEGFPTVSAQVVGLERRGDPGPSARVALSWNARVRVSLHGRTVEKVIPVRWQLDGLEWVTAEALGEFRFTEFGIEPYSAMLGAVKNTDLFHIYVKIVARPAAGGPPAEAE